MPRITPNLWFDTNALEAAEFYVSVFPNSEIAALAHDLLDRLPARRQPPKTVPPLRRPEVRARMDLEPFPA